jgi:UDPglucose 6-dehydrogenase
MDVTVIGCGYVGLVTGTCLASIGHTVRGVEKDQKKLKTLLDGHCPIFEPGLQELMQEHYASGQLQFTDNVKLAVKDAEVVFLCVGTPPKPDGTVDMSYLEGAGKEVCDALAENNTDYMTTIIVKSTVPAGTNRKLYNFLKEQTKAYVQVVSNPEFLKEGSAVQDCLNPDRIVIGGESPEAFRQMRRLYDPLVKREENFLTMNWESAELTKYAANSMLAARISFMNEMTILCEFYGADIEEVRKGIGSDSRIGPAFLRAGCGYGGSCFPKDVAAMEHISRTAGHESLFDRQQEPEEAIRRQDRSQAQSASGRRDDRRLGPGIQSRHRRHPRIRRAGCDPLSARQGRSRPRDRSQGHGEHEAGLHR